MISTQIQCDFCQRLADRENPQNGYLTLRGDSFASDFKPTDFCSLDCLWMWINRKHHEIPVPDPQC